MNDLTDEQRARALELYRLYHRTLTDVESAAADAGLLDGDVKAWLGLEEFILQSHTCRPVWRPTTRDEIQAGWEVRSRSRSGEGVAWGTAHSRDDHGVWLTEAKSLLTYDLMCWTYETTAPEPEPEPDPRVGLLEGVCLREGVVLTRSDAALLLSIADAAERPEAGA